MKLDHCGLLPLSSPVWYMVFFFKQKTAYEMRISDWSSDVCSSDLLAVLGDVQRRRLRGVELAGAEQVGLEEFLQHQVAPGPRALSRAARELGRASCRERVCQYVSLSVVAVSLQNKHTICNSIASARISHVPDNLLTLCTIYT